MNKRKKVRVQWNLLTVGLRRCKIVTLLDQCYCLFRSLWILVVRDSKPRLIVNYLFHFEKLTDETGFPRRNHDYSLITVQLLPPLIHQKVFQMYKWLIYLKIIINLKLINSNFPLFIGSHFFMYVTEILKKITVGKYLCSDFIRYVGK